MAFDPAHADAIRAALAGRPGLSEKRMFGGLCFMLDGNMLCGVDHRELMLRVGPEAYDACCAEPDAGPMTITGRPMRGFVGVPLAVADDPSRLAFWLDRAIAFVATLPAK